MLRRGTIVLCIEWPVNSSSPDTTVGPSPDSPAPVAENASIWIHVSLVYERPLVLTLLLMERDAARDRPGLLGLNATKEGDSSRGKWLTHVELFGDFVDFKAGAIHVKLFELACSADRRMVDLTPWQQFVRSLDLDPIDMRSMPKARNAKSKRRATGSRGRGNKGRGRGRARARGDGPGGRGPPAPDGEADPLDDPDSSQSGLSGLSENSPKRGSSGSRVHTCWGARFAC